MTEITSADILGWRGGGGRRGIQGRVWLDLESCKCNCVHLGGCEEIIERHLFPLAPRLP